MQVLTWFIENIHCYSVTALKIIPSRKKPVNYTRWWQKGGWKGWNRVWEGGKTPYGGMRSGWPCSTKLSSIAIYSWCAI